MKNEYGFLALCDKESEYVCHLAEYLKYTGSVPAGIRVFTGSEKLLEFLAPADTALLVIAESEYTEEVIRAGFPSVLVLNESGRYMEEPRNISKYQSMDVIAGTILAMCAESGGCDAPAVRHGGPMQVIGFFTPCHRSLQTTMSIALGQALGEQAKTLYLNFEPFPGTFYGSGQSFRGSMADLLYFSDTAKEKVSSRLPMITEKMGTLDFVPPFPSFRELSQVGKEQWLSLIAILGEVTDYTYLILDLTESVSGLIPVLDACSRIYTICRKDSLSAAKIGAYQEFLKEAEADRIVAHTKFVELPRFENLPERPGDPGAEQPGKWIRDRLRNEGL